MQQRTISLSKGQTISLSKEDPNLDEIQIGLGWKQRTTDGAEYDLDASVFMVDANGRSHDSGDFVFYNSPTDVASAVIHHGDNKEGSNDPHNTDAEVIDATLSKVIARHQKLVVVVTIHDAEALNQNFGEVEGAYIRLVNKKTGQEIARYDLSEEYSTATAMIFAEIYRYNSEWKFRAVGNGFNGGLYAAAKSFGLDVKM